MFGLTPEFHHLSLRVLGLPRQTFNALTRNGIKTLGALDALDETQFLAIPRLGTSSLVYVRAAVAAFDQHLWQTRFAMTGSMHSIAEPQGVHDAPLGSLLHIMPTLHTLPISALQLPATVFRSFHDGGIATIGELARRSEKDVLAHKYANILTIDHILHTLVACDVELRAIAIRYADIAALPLTVVAAGLSDRTIIGVRQAGLSNLGMLLRSSGHQLREHVGLPAATVAAIMSEVYRIDQVVLLKLADAIAS